MSLKCFPAHNLQNVKVVLLASFAHFNWTINRQFLTLFVCMADCSATAQYSVGPNGHQYMRCDSKKKYEDAKALCAIDGAHLVTIASQQEQDFVKDLQG